MKQVDMLRLRSLFRRWRRGRTRALPWRIQDFRKGAGGRASARTGLRRGATGCGAAFRWCAIGFGLLLAMPVRAGAIPLRVASDGNRPAEALPLTVPVQLPSENSWYLRPFQASNWLDAKALQYSIRWPTNAPADAQTMLFVIDRDDRWYQALQERPLVPGRVNTFEVPLTSGALVWQPVGHAAAWHYRVRLNPKAVGLRIFGRTNYVGSCVLLSASLLPNDPWPAPVIARVRPSAPEAACFQLYEVSFELPDRYADPFDPAQIDVSAVFTTPDGQPVPVNGFYYQSFYRQRDATQNATPQAQGRPEWRVRFCPRTPGAYRYTLRVRDAYGQAEWKEGRFTATPAEGPRFVRVSPVDRRYFDFDNGALFYPIGHNVRSAYDSRMDDKFPWKLRHPEGTLAYERFFRDMAAAQENLVEIWSCAWSLGLEWSDVIPGYHGSGDYNLSNAWELDRVLDQARQQRMRVNLVLNNHGRVSSWLDVEWGDNPYHVSRGGWLRNAIDFFSDARAIDMQRRLYRYYIARWGWDSTIFAWELFSEVNLTGHQTNQRTADDPRVVEWHRVMGAFFHAEDPNRHLVTTHISADYTMQNPDLCKLPELDACAVDAYHYAQPSQIIAVLQGTANFNNAFDKPILVTEFGGSPMAAGLEHLKRELHAALWSSTCIPLAGTPLFWWWQLIEERNLYSEYAAIARFLQGMDPRNPALKPVAPGLRFADEGDEKIGERLQVVAMSSGTNAIGWIYAPEAFSQNVTPAGAEGGAWPTISRLQVVFGSFQDGLCRVEFVDTATGTVCHRGDVRASGGQLKLAVPGFTRDIAFRVASLPPAPPAMPTPEPGNR